MLILMAVLQEDGLTFREVIQDVPHDAPAIVVYAMLALFVMFIWHGSRKSGKARPENADQTELGEDTAENENDPELRSR